MIPGLCDAGLPSIKTVKRKGSGKCEMLFSELAKARAK